MSCIDLTKEDAEENGSPVSSGVISPAEPQDKQTSRVKQGPRGKSYMVFSQASDCKGAACQVAAYQQQSSRHPCEGMASAGHCLIMTALCWLLHCLQAHRPRLPKCHRAGIFRSAKRMTSKRVLQCAGSNQGHGTEGYPKSICGPMRSRCSSSSCTCCPATPGRGSWLSGTCSHALGQHVNSVRWGCSGSAMTRSPALTTHLVCRQHRQQLQARS